MKNAVRPRDAVRTPSRRAVRAAVERSRGAGPGPNGARGSLRRMLRYAQGEHLPLLPLQPADEDGEHQLESGGVDHGRSLYHGQGFGAGPSNRWDTTGVHAATDIALILRN